MLYDITNDVIAYMHTNPDTDQSFILKHNMIYNVNKAAIYLNTACNADNIIIRCNTIIISSNHSIIKSANVSNFIAAMYGNVLLNSDRDLHSSHGNSLQIILDCNLDSDTYDIEYIAFIIYSDSTDLSTIDLYFNIFMCNIWILYRMWFFFPNIWYWWW